MGIRYQHRFEARWPVSIPAVLRINQNARSKSSVSDISPLGCRVTWQGRKLAVGEPVFIQIDNLAPIKASVIWQQWPLHGLQFEHPLHPAVVEHLVTTWAHYTH